MALRNKKWIILSILIVAQVTSIAFGGWLKL